MLVPSAVTVPPVQLLVTLGELATSKPAGKVSVKLTVCAGFSAGLLTVKVSVLVPPMLMLVGLKALVRVGVKAVTVKHWLVTPLVRLLRPLIWPAPLVLAAVPGQAPTVGVSEVVMFTVMVQVVGVAVPAPTCLPATTMLVPSAVAVTVPLVQVPPTVDGLATRKPAGKVSVKLTVCAGLPAGLLTVKVSVLVPPMLMLLGLKALVRVAIFLVLVYVHTIAVSVLPTVRVLPDKPLVPVQASVVS